MTIKIITILGFLGLFSASIWFVYNKGYDAGETKATVACVSGLNKARDELHRANNALLAEQREKFKEQLDQMQLETNLYANELREQTLRNNELREALDKTPEVTAQYKGCKYTPEDHQNMLKLYEDEVSTLECTRITGVCGGEGNGISGRSSNDSPGNSDDNPGHGGDNPGHNNGKGKGHHKDKGKGHHKFS